MQQFPGTGANRQNALYFALTATVIPAWLLVSPTRIETGTVLPGTTLANPSDTAVARVREVNVARAVQGNPFWGIQLSFDGRAIIAAEVTGSDIVHRGAADSRQRGDDVVLGQCGKRNAIDEKSNRQKAHLEKYPILMAID
jgi:hypothetical protein